MRMRQGSSVGASELSGRVFSRSFASEGDTSFRRFVLLRASRCSGFGCRPAFAALGTWAVECQLSLFSTSLSAALKSPKWSGTPQTSVHVAANSALRFPVPVRSITPASVRRHRPQWKYSLLPFHHLSYICISLSCPIFPAS